MLDIHTIFKKCPLPIPCCLLLIACCQLPISSSQLPAPDARSGRGTISRRLLSKAVRSWEPSQATAKTVYRGRSFSSKQSLRGEFSWKLREIEIPNNSRFSAFIINLANLVDWVGFATGITFTTYLWIVEFSDFQTFWWKSIFEPGLSRAVRSLRGESHEIGNTCI